MRLVNNRQYIEIAKNDNYNTTEKKTYNFYDLSTIDRIPSGISTKIFNSTQLNSLSRSVQGQGPHG